MGLALSFSFGWSFGRRTGVNDAQQYLLLKNTVGGAAGDAQKLNVAQAGLEGRRFLCRQHDVPQVLHEALVDFLGAPFGKRLQLNPKGSSGGGEVGRKIGESVAVGGVQELRGVGRVVAVGIGEGVDGEVRQAELVHCFVE